MKRWQYRLNVGNNDDVAQLRLAEINRGVSRSLAWLVCFPVFTFETWLSAEQLVRWYLLNQ